MSSAHTLSPLAVPADFAKAPPTYRLRVWMAMLGLLLFVVFYVGLAGWFTYTAYRMMAGVLAGGEGAMPCCLPTSALGSSHRNKRPGREIRPRLTVSRSLFNANF